MGLNLANKSKTGIFYGWVVVVAGSLILLLGWGCQYSYGVFFTELCADLNWTRAMVSGAYSLGFLWHGIIYFVAGSLNDRYGPRLMITISAVVMGLGYALMSVIEAPWHLYIFYGIVIGTGLGFSYIPVSSTVSRWFVRRRGTALGLTAAGIGMGGLVLAPVAQFLITKFDWRTSYLILAGLVVVIVLPLSRLMRLDPSEKGLLPYGREESAIENEQLGNSLSSEVSFSLKQATRTSQFWLLAVMYASYPFAVQMVMVHLKAYAVDFGIAEMTAATALGLVGGASTGGRIVMGSLSDRIGRKTSFFIAYLLMAVMMLWLIKTRQPWQLYLFSVVFGFGHGSCVPLFPAVIGDWFGTKFHGSIFGMLGIGLGIGGAIGPLLAGYIFDITRSYDIAIIIGAVALFIALGCSFAIKAPYRLK
jgi:MFS family permease